MYSKDIPPHQQNLLFLRQGCPWRPLDFYDPEAGGMAQWWTRTKLVRVVQGECGTTEGVNLPPRNVPPQPPEIAGLTIKGLAEALVSLNKVGY